MPSGSELTGTQDLPKWDDDQPGETRIRLKNLSPERRNQLLDPAEAEFASHGYQRASLNRMLAAAGISKGQAYYYVSNKAELYRAVMERALERVIAAVDGRFPRAESAKEFWGQIREFFVRLTGLLQQDERLAALARSMYEGPETEAALRDLLARIRTYLDRWFALGSSIGAVRGDVPPSLLRDVTFAAAREMDRWFAEHWQEMSVEEALAMNDKAVGMIRAMAAPAPSAEARSGAGT